MGVYLEWYSLNTIKQTIITICILLDRSRFNAIEFTGVY